MINPNDTHKYKYTKYFNNFDVSKDIIKDTLDTLESKDLSWPFGVTQKFEEKIAKFLKIKYTLAHCNGTSAMYSAMFAVGVGKNTEVICPTYTFWASISPAVNLGAKVVFCDINQDDLLIDVKNIRKYITDKTKAIIVPHLWGRMADIDQLKKICSEYDHKIFIIEDASHCFGATYKNKYLGTLTDIGIFSMQAGKILIAGEGGMLVTNNFDFYDSAIFLGHYERIRFVPKTKYLEYSDTGGGYKFRIHPLASTLAMAQLKTIKEKTRRQDQLIKYFETKLESTPGVKVLKRNYNDFEYGGRFGLRIFTPLTENKKMRFIEECKDAGLKIESEYLPLLHMEKFFMNCDVQNSGKGAFKKTEELHGHLISFPLFYNGDAKVIDSFIGDFQKVLKKYII